MATKYRITYFKADDLSSVPSEHKPEYDSLVSAVSDFKAFKKIAARGYPMLLEKLEVERLERLMVGDD